MSIIMNLKKKSIKEKDLISPSSSTVAATSSSTSAVYNTFNSNTSNTNMIFPAVTPAFNSEAITTDKSKKPETEKKKLSLIAQFRNVKATGNSNALK